MVLFEYFWDVGPHRRPYSNSCAQWSLESHLQAIQGFVVAYLPLRICNKVRRIIRRKWPSFRKHLSDASLRTRRIVHYVREESYLEVLLPHYVEWTTVRILMIDFRPKIICTSVVRRSPRRNKFGPVPVPNTVETLIVHVVLMLTSPITK